MADTTWTLGTDSSGFSYPGATYNRALVFTVGDKELRKEIGDKLIFSPFIGKNGELSPIVKKTDLTKNKGDTLRMAMLPKLSENGTYGDIPLVGEEEPLEFSYVDVNINQIRHAVMEEGQASSIRGLFNVLEHARPALSSWYAQELEDSIIRTILYGWPPHIHTTTATGGLNKNSHVARPCRYWYCADETNNSITYSSTDATYESAIETAEGTLSNVAADYFSPNILEVMGVKMRVINIPNMDIKGFNGYLCVLHPYQVAQLRSNSTWFNAQINAGPRNEKGNLVFGGVQNGIVGFWNRFCIMESNKIATSAQAARASEVPINGADDADVRRAICMGAGAVAYAEGKKPSHGTEVRDYGNKTGVSIGAIMGLGRADYVEDSSDATLTAQHTMVISTFSKGVVT